MNTRERLANTVCQRDTYVPGFPRGRHISDGSKNSLKMLKAKRQLAVRFLDSICKGILHFKILFFRGVGANFVYPLLAIAEFGWLMTGSEVNKKSIEWADDNIIRLNPYLKEHFKGPIRL